MAGDGMEVSAGGGGGSGNKQPQISMVGLFLACMVAGGVQYGWALQLSLLTPYVQTLGIPHALTSVMWLCGPIAGLLVQPCVGLYSDKCTSKLGRRRPFIFTGCIIICISVIVIGFSSDIGYALGDTTEDCKVYTGKRLHAALFFVMGFWLLDFSNNTVQGPARALMADLAGSHGPSTANAIFVSWMAIGNILGYSSGSTDKWHTWFPFLQTKACCEARANLKAAFLVSVVFLGLSTVVTMIFANEVPLDPAAAKQGEEGEPSGPFAVFKGMKNLPPGMPQVFIVTGLTWLSWFPFILFDTDWMGREMYHGRPDGSPTEVANYQEGVRQGAFGLLLNSIVPGVSSFLIEPMCRKLTAKVVWVMSSFLVCVAMAMVTVLSSWALGDIGGNVQDAAAVDKGLKSTALAIFVFLGFPFAVLCSVPFAVTAQLAASKGGGQGLCTGVLNISIVVPQMIIAVGSGPWDELFGKGNIPAFGVAAVFAFTAAIAGIIMLPKQPKTSFRSVSMGGGH
uniref:Sucrose transport protein SUT3 n=1 Tax=Saccharum hybrid cultivar GT28 TaxID=1214490 RepID=A0A384RI85_9POAL|nr:sucrose transporter 6 [Saccharum hybrid cultivar GT28]